ncbi:MAG: radical SAM protein [Muribaculaceae bacterium]|nr:radical SAM protein [Muribaculaceae bacterium]
MQTVLFHSTVFGPIHSRRLGVSLGINLSPDDGKICSFDCLYCEAGFNAQGPGTTGFPSMERLSHDLRVKLADMKRQGSKLDVITFSGNGEPTLHPQFPEAIDIVTALRDEFYPDAKISVLTNSTRIDRPEVVDALRRADNAILKLDSALTPTMRLIDRPNSPGFTSEGVIARLEDFGEKAIIQTMLLRGEYDGQVIDNTTDEEVDALVQAVMRIKPREVMLYTIDRPTPLATLSKVSPDDLERVARKLRDHGITVATAG